MRASLLFWVLLAGVLLIVSGLVFQDYFFLDEPNILWSYRCGKAWSDYYPRFVGEGRPLYGILQIGAIGALGTLAKLKYLRIISVLLTFLFCSLLYFFLKKNKIEKGVALLVSALVFSLPGFSVFIGWAQSYPHHLSSMLSFFSGMLLTRAYLPYIDSEAKPASSKTLLLAAALVMQVVSLMNYQTTALALLLPGFFVLLLKNQSPARNRLIFMVCYVSAFFVFLFVYYELFQFILSRTHIQIVDRGQLGGDPAGKLIWFLKILTEASRLQLLLIKKGLLGYLLTAAIGFFVVRDLWKRRFLDLFFVFAFCVLAFFPHLLIRESWGASRNFCLLSVILSFYRVIRFFELVKAPSLTVALVIALPFIGMMCFNLSESWTGPQKEDYRQITALVNKLPALKEKNWTVEVIPPEFDYHERNSILRSYYDEFNAPVFLPLWPIEPTIQILYNDRFPTLPVSEVGKRLQIIISPDKTFHLPESDTTFRFNLNKR
jgi:hypothetical protein